MYDVIKGTVVRDLRLWVSSTEIRLKDEVSGRAGRLRACGPAADFWDQGMGSEDSRVRI
jgi:hypothetical protein